MRNPGGSELVMKSVLVLMMAGVFWLTQSVGTALAQGTTQTDSVSRGFQRRTFVDDNGAEHRYVIFVPHDYRPGSRPPVILSLNGHGENGDDGIRQITGNFGVPVWESREFFPFLAVAPQCQTNGSWASGSLDAKWAMQILDEVIREFQADEDRIYLTGVSAGGSAAWDFASAFPMKFAAVIPLCGSGGGDLTRITESRIAIWNFYNGKDEKELVESNRRIREELIGLGCSPIFTEYPVGMHDCWSRGYRTAALYEWLSEQRRSNNIKAALFTPASTSHLLSNWKQSGGGSWSAHENGDLVGRGKTVNDVGLLVADVASDSMELHGDVWLTSSGCRVALLQREADEHPAWISIMSADHGTGGFSDSDGKYLSRLSPAAQRSLRQEAWNDVRIRVAEDRLTVHLNGWKGLDVALSTLDVASGKSQYRCAFATPDNDSEIRWRLVRVRTPSKVQEPLVGSSN